MSPPAEFGLTCLLVAYYTDRLCPLQWVEYTTWLAIAKQAGKKFRETDKETVTVE